MASLRDIRDRINSVKNTQQVTSAMKMVAAAKLRRAQERIFKTRPYAFKLGEMISHLQRQADPAEHDLFLPRDVRQGVLVIIVTADRGLAGAFNSNAIKLAETTIREQYADVSEDNLYLLCVGRKSHEHFAKRDYQLVGDFRGLFNDLSFSAAQDIVDAAVEGYLDKQWDEVTVVYNEFKNTISQNRIAEPLLPIPKERFLTPVMEAEVEGQEAAEAEGPVDYIFEPGAEEILEALVPRYLNYQVWRLLLESNAAEQGARMVAMDNATSNADDLLRDLKLSYNRARQDAITKELIEITSGADALSG
ncbi:MAG: ATP synthase F1 subunit gamma [Rhodothermales bacterium]